MKFKPGVPTDTLKPPIADKLPLIERIVCKHRPELVITSTTDGKHKKNSLHYKGLAIDIRTWGVKDRPRLRRELQEALGPEYDVVLEASHIHCEHDPKTSHHSQQVGA